MTRYPDDGRETKTMRIRVLSEDRLAEQHNDLPEANPIYAAYANGYEVYDSEPKLIEESEALRLSRRANTHRYMTVSLPQGVILPPNYPSLLLRGLDRHPLVRAGKADYIYWPIQDTPLDYGVVLHSKTMNDLALYPEDAFGWRKDMRLAVEDTRPMKDINDEVSKELMALSDVKLDRNSTQ